MASLNVKAVLAKILQCPMVVESGTSGIWTYRKWSDGTAECWGSNTTTQSFAAWGNIYSSDITPSLSYPSGLFTSVPAVFATSRFNTSLNAVGSVTSGRGAPNNTDVPYVTIVRGSTTSGNISTTTYYYAIGKWK